MSAGRVSRRRFLTIAAGMSGALLVPGPLFAGGTRPGAFSWKGQVLGAEAQLKLIAEDKQSAERIVSACLQEAGRLERIFSLFRPGSSIRTLNASGRLKNPPAELVEVLRAAERLSELSCGAFDVSVQPVWRYLYYLAPVERARIKNAGSVENAEFEELKALVDYRRILISPEEVSFADRGMEITLNGIAQGFITDRIAALLRQHGMTDVLIDFGEVYALGKNETRAPWRIGIRSSAGSEAGKSLELQNQAIATSSAFGLSDAPGFSHLLDARSGESCRSYRSLSVIADSAAIADGLSTALSLLPRSRHGEILANYPAASQIIT